VLKVALAFEQATDHHRVRPQVRRVEPPPPKDQFAPPPPADVDAERRAQLEDAVRRGLDRHGIPLLDEDLEALVDDLHAFRVDLAAGETESVTALEPAVHQVPR
jgi:hypothetical protein